MSFDRYAYSSRLSTDPAQLNAIDQHMQEITSFMIFSTFKCFPLVTQGRFKMLSNAMKHGYHMPHLSRSQLCHFCNPNGCIFVHHTWLRAPRWYTQSLSLIERCLGYWAWLLLLLGIVSEDTVSVQYNTWLLNKLTPKGVVFSFLSPPLCSIKHDLQHARQNGGYVHSQQAQCKHEYQSLVWY